MLDRARTKLPDVELVWGRAEELPWPERSFDRVLCVNALHHFDDARTFVREAYRVLKPGGMLLNIGLDPHSGEDRWFIYDYFPTARSNDEARFATTSRIRDWMHDAGFSRTETNVAWSFQSFHPYRGPIDPASTSQLLNLSPVELDKGMTSLAQSHAKAIEAGQDLELVVDLRLFATRGWVSED
jgi:SAM-dependent methyltransferase